MPFRGNVQTRLAKLEAGEVQATLLAGAGLQRLGMGKVGTPIPLDVVLPAPTQAVIAIECRSDDAMTSSVLTIIDDRTTHALINAERAFTAALGGSCHSPVAAYAEIVDGRVRLRTQILSEDGRDQVRDEARFDCGDRDTPRQLAHSMLEKAPELYPLLIQGRMRRLFVFRPEPASQQTIRLAQDLGLDAVSLPLFELEAIDWTPPDAADFDGILLTSANTAPHGGREIELFPSVASTRSWRGHGRRG